MADELETTQVPETDTTASEAAQTTDVDYKAELEKARKALADVNRESAKRRKQLEAYEAEEAKRKAESMTELEKAQAALAELEKRASDAERGRKQALLEKAVIAKAGTLKFINAEDAMRYLNPETLEIGADGQVSGLEDALEAIAKDHPYLLQQAETQQGRLGATNPGRGNTTGETSAQRRARLYGLSDGNPFAGPGGGVITP